MPEPTFGWEDFPDYKGMVPGQALPPMRTSLLEPGIEGERLLLTGRVLTRSGTPLAGAKLDFWQADTAGRYDMAPDRMGYRLRGVQLTSGEGEFRLETILPGHAGQVRHINYIAMVRPPGRRQQLYLHAAIFFATDEELDHVITRAERPYRRPGAVRNRDDGAFLRLDALPVVEGVRRASYHIVFDLP